MNPLEVNEEIVLKILDTIKPGITRGLGKPIPGKMCIEAAICYAYGLEHSDQPKCVNLEVIRYKIGLNDCKWPDNKTREKGLRKLAIAQLGSLEINKEEFRIRIFEETQKHIIPVSFDFVPEDKRCPEHDELKEFAINTFNIELLVEKFKNYSCKNYNYYNYYNNYDDYYYYNYYNYYYYYYSNNYTKNQSHTILKLSADVAVKVLCDMGSEGSKYLHLVSTED